MSRRLRLLIRSARLHAEAARLLGLDRAAPMIAMRAQSLARAAVRAKRDRRAEYV